MAKEVQMSIKMEAELRDQFIAVAAAMHRPAAQIVRELMRAYILRHETPNAETLAAIEAVERGGEYLCQCQRFLPEDGRLTPLRVLHTGNQFKKDFKHAKHRGKNMAQLRTVINLLLTGQALPRQLNDHPLKDQWKDYRDLHIEPVKKKPIRN